MHISPKAHHPIRSIATALAVAAVLACYLATDETAEATASTGASEGLQADASVFGVTGEETDPITVTFSNGKKTVTFIPMIHIGTPAFYKAVAEKVKERKEDGATLYYEFIDFDALDENNKRKARAGHVR